MRQWLLCARRYFSCGAVDGAGKDASDSMPPVDLVTDCAWAEFDVVMALNVVRATQLARAVTRAVDAAHLVSPQMLTATTTQNTTTPTITHTNPRTNP